MSLIKKIKDKKVNFEFNKEYLKVVINKITNNDAQFITNSFNSMKTSGSILKLLSFIKFSLSF